MCFYWNRRPCFCLFTLDTSLRKKKTKKTKKTQKKLGFFKKGLYLCFINKAKMDKITKSQIKDYVKQKLATDPIWALKGLVKIFDFQTLDEQKSKDTKYHNGVGFSGTDGHILSSMALQFLKKRHLSEKQMAIVYKKMPKYWSQIVKISDMDTLKDLIRTEETVT